MIENRFITVKELAQYLHIGMNKAYKLCKQADFPICKFGNKIYIDKKALDNTWIPNKTATTLH